MAIQTSDLGKVVLAEHVEQLEKPDFSMFAEELRRMQKYDTEVCPVRWQDAVQYVAKKGWDPVEVLARFGERKFYSSYWDKREELRYSQDDIEKLIALFNYVEQEREKLQKPLKGILYVHLPLDKGEMNNDLKKILRSKKIKKKEYRGPIMETWRETGLAQRHIRKSKYNEKHSHSKSATCFPLKDKIAGISTLFGCCEHEEAYWDFDQYDNDAMICGVPEKDPQVFFELGRIDISSLKPIVKRRFTYIFGTVPLDDHDIIEALVELNGFPRMSVRYKLEEGRLSELKPTRGISLMHKEALEARKKGLFTDVKVYKLVGEKMQRIRDPVIVGIDPFGQKYPIVYWGGDPGLITKK